MLRAAPVSPRLREGTITVVPMARRIYICNLEDEPERFWTRKANEFSGTCANEAQHTLSPRGYIAWHQWARRMGRTHRCQRCPECSLWTIWVPKQPAEERTANVKEA